MINISLTGSLEITKRSQGYLTIFMFSYGVFFPEEAFKREDGFMEDGGSLFLANTVGI
jgi:hypothetical protein